MNPQAIEATLRVFGEKVENRIQMETGYDFNKRFYIEGTAPSDTLRVTNLTFFDEIVMRYDLPNQATSSYYWLKYLTKCDPTPKSLYTKWLLRRWFAGEFRLMEDVSQAGDLLDLFHHGKPHLPVERRDINRIKSMDDLRTLVASLPEDLRSQRQQDRDVGLQLIATGEAEVFHDDDAIRIIIPKTKEAAIYFGRNTRWCTSALYGNMFDSYANDGPLYIILFKAENIRWQFHFKSAQFMDEQDKPLSRDTIRESAVYGLMDWKAAFKANATNFIYLPKPTVREKVKGLRIDGVSLQYIENPTREEIIAGITSYPPNILNDRFDEPEYRRIAIGNSGTAAGRLIRDMDDVTPEEFDLASQQDPRIIYYLREDQITEKLALNSMRGFLEQKRYPRGRYSTDYYRGDSPLAAYYRDDVKRDHPLYMIPVPLINAEMIILFHAAQGFHEPIKASKLRGQSIEENRRLEERVYKVYRALQEMAFYRGKSHYYDETFAETLAIVQRYMPLHEAERFGSQQGSRLMSRTLGEFSKAADRLTSRMSLDRLSRKRYSFI